MQVGAKPDESTFLELTVLASPTAIWANVFLLILTALAKVGFTAWTFGMMVRSLEVHALGYQTLTIHVDPCWYLPSDHCDRGMPRACCGPHHVSSFRPKQHIV